MASSSSFYDSQIKHDVFISFSGKDTRRGFLSHLVKELRRENIIVCVDEELNRGEEISSSLLREIQRSQISIVIFSENYASSRWCLDELEEIMKCRKVNKQIVLPIFYYIDPSHVRHQRGAYENAFAEHELRFQGNGLKVQNWRSALKNAADLFGYGSSRYGTDSELIDEIVKHVLDEIVKHVLLGVNDIYPSESNGLVGIDQHLDRIRSFLEMESKEVQILGIWGMSGIGKTTIAQAAIEKFSSNYEGSCFLDNVREESHKHRLKSLRKKLISQLQEEKSTSIRRGLIRRSKVLVVLDDVGTPEELEGLVKEGFHWGPGSRVIATSQNKQALIAGGVHANDILEVKKLDFEESLNLFSLNAFNNSHPDRGYEELSKQAAAYADGLPLALKVLGLHLCSCDRETWKSTLGKLEMYPHPQIQDVLQTSYDGLDDVEREIFLDIAFFYKGEDKDHVKRQLDANNLFAAYGIKGLLDKALISISNDNGIQMHELIQEMGWEIVRQECKDNPGGRSRLKDFEEVYDVLKNNRGTDAIKGIVLYASLFKDVRLNVDTFKNMTNLRIVKFYSSWHVRCCNVHPPTSFLSFSDELRRLQWDGYPHPYPEKLVGHSMPNNHVGKLWKLVQDYANSKRMSLDSSKQSMELIDFTKAQKIEWEDMCSCKRFCNVNSHILSLSMTAAVNLVRSKDSKKRHRESNVGSLINFDVGLCFSVRVFSLSSKEISEVDFVTSKFEILCSSSVGGLNKLRRITHGDSRLEIVPLNELCCLRFFEELNLYDCRRMNQSPELRMLFDALLYLRELFMTGCSVFFKSPHTIGTSSSFNYLTDLCIRQYDGPTWLFETSYVASMTSTELVLVRVIFEPGPVNILPCLASFLNVLELFAHFLCDPMDHAYFLLNLAVQKNIRASFLCQSSGRVPKWFKYVQTTVASTAMQLSPAADALLALVFCVVLPRFLSKMRPTHLKCLCYFEDGEKLEESWASCPTAEELGSADSVFLWYDPRCSKRIVKGLETKLGKGEDVPKVSFEFYAVTYYYDNGKVGEHECLIKECGVHLIYASEQQLELASELKTELLEPGSFMCPAVRVTRMMKKGHPIIRGPDMSRGLIRHLSFPPWRMYRSILSP